MPACPLLSVYGDKVWRHTFNELRVVVGADEEADEDVCGVVMTESVSSQYGPKQPREQMTQVTHSLCSPCTDRD